MTTMRDIVQEVAARHKITLDEIYSSSREHRIAHPRQEAMAAIYATGRYSTTQVGRHFGKDHTTVVHALRRVAERRGE